MNANTFTGLLTDASFWQTLAVICGGVFFSLPNGLIQQLIGWIVSGLTGWLKGRVPAAQYAAIQQFAADACRAAYQKGESLNLTNADRKAYALESLTAIAKAHGISRFNAAALDAIIENVWNSLKPMLVADGVLPATLLAGSVSAAVSAAVSDTVAAAAATGNTGGIAGNDATGAVGGVGGAGGAA